MKTLTKIIDLLKICDKIKSYPYIQFLMSSYEQAIRSMRKSKGLTQHEFGKLICLNRRTMEHWEKERVQI